MDRVQGDIACHEVAADLKRQRDLSGSRTPRPNQATEWRKKQEGSITKNQRDKNQINRKDQIP